MTAAIDAAASALHPFFDFNDAPDNLAPGGNKDALRERLLDQLEVVLSYLFPRGQHRGSRFVVGNRGRCRRRSGHHAASPSAWLFRVASNAIADHYRRRFAEQRAMAQLEAAGGQTERESEAQDEESASAALAQCLLPLLRNLPEPYGEALRLTDIEGLTQTAAARRLGLSTSGMKSRVQRGRTKLKQALLRCRAVQTDRQGAVVDYQPRAPGSKDCSR
jgi:RNA polymerase sigma factor (sigma-70 family)